MTLPTGTVTFLFTDIEGSTRLMQELGDRYLDARNAHHSILRDAFRSSRGRELRTEGDSFFCVFESALEACSAATSAQRALAAYEWPGGAAIRVRMGLHSGEAPLAGNEYVGLDVHHAARIAAAAHGGQVLLSEATRALVEAGLPEGVTIRNLGVHRLKDLVRSESLYQLCIDGLPDQFPALRTLEGVPNNLPTQLTSFIGRRDAVDDVGRLLKSARLLTMTGPGGIGKTRLSLQVAAEIGPEFPDGVFFIPLSAVRDPDLVPSAITQVLALPVSGSRTPLDALLEHVRDRGLLLVLDNFEQLLPDGAAVVSRLLQSGAGLKILVSSRSALRVYGEQEYAVEPLRLPNVKTASSLEALSQYEAVKLFIERAVSVKPDFQATNENAPAIAGICERVDGLPLAIELAAARVKLFSPQALLGRLETSIAVLAGGARDLPSRQQTLQGAIAWSHDLLDAPGKRLFARFAVFMRGANLEDAEKVCGPAEELGVDVLTGLDELADHSLLRRLPDLDEPRLIMLMTIREFALEQLRMSGEEEAVRNRHAAAYEELAEEAAKHLFGAEQKAWLDRLELDNDNFRAALDWCLASGDAARAISLATSLWRFWQMRGHLHEGRARLDAILALPRSHDQPAARADALEAAGGIAYWQGDMDSAEAYYDESLQLAREVGDPRTIANALYNDSFPKNVTKADPAASRALLEEALPIFRQIGDEAGVARCEWGLGMAYYNQDDYPGAIPHIEEAISMFRRLGDRFGLGWAFYIRSGIALRLGDRPAAKELSSEALRLFADANDVSAVVLIFDNLAEVARQDGDLIRAARLAGAAAAHEASTGTGLGGVARRREGWAPSEGLSEAEASAWREGEAMDVKQAIAYALEAGESPAVAQA